MSQCTMKFTFEAANHTTLACLAAFKKSKSNLFNHLDQATFSPHKRHHGIKEMSHADH